VGYESFQASEDATPLRVARSKALFSEERWVGKQLDHDGAEDFGKPILGIETVNDILQKLWDLEIHEAICGWRGTTIHPSGECGKREKDLDKLLGASFFAVDNA
jgi:hypothetical protein